MSAPTSAPPRTGDVLAEAAELSRLGPPGPAQLDRLATRLREWAASFDVEHARSMVTTDEPRCVVQAHRSGPLLGLRLTTGDASTIHSHDWTVLHQLAGDSVLERYRPAGDGSAQLCEARLLSEGETVALATHQVHRQVGLGPESLEVTLLGSNHFGQVRAEYRPAASGGSAELITGFTSAYQAGDAKAVSSLYRPDALLDANVPQWRFQVQGPAAIRELLETEEFRPGFRLACWRAVPTVDGAVIETECRIRELGGEHLVREVHLLRGTPDGIADHVLYCTGIWDPDTIQEQAANAPMVRP